MLTSVVIPCYDGADDTRACLQALAASEPAGPLEIVVVDNGSRDPAAIAAAAATHPCARVLALPRNLGFAGGTNRGVAAARGEVVVVLNNDTLPAPTMLARLLRALDALPAPAMVAPVSNFVRGEARLAVGDRGHTDAGRRELEALLAESCGGLLEDVDSLAGLCLMFRRDLWDAIGTFDERFGLGNHEDDDLSLRVRLRGGRLAVVRDAFLHHWGSRTFRALGVDYARQLDKTEAIMHAKWRDEPAWHALQAATKGDLAAAGELAVRALARWPNWPDGQLLIARAAFGRGEHARAAEFAAIYLRACPSSWVGHQVHTVALLRAGRLRDAVAAVQAALARCYAEPEAAARLLTQVAHGLVAHGEFRGARESLQAALELSRTGDRLCLFGQICATLGDGSGADRAFAEAAACGHGDGLLLRGIHQWHLGDRAVALCTLGAAVAQAPEDPRPRQVLAQVLAACAEAGVDTSRATQALAAAR